MRTLKLALLGNYDEVIRTRIDATLAGEIVLRRQNLPALAADSIVRELQQLRPDVIVVDVSGDPDPAVAAVDILARETQIPIFAIGDLKQPQLIIRAMRAGACEFLDRDVNTSALLEAFARLHTLLQGRKSNTTQRGRLITLLSAKGGCGATTIAVNTALALQKQCSRVALVDLAPLGHASLHLNIRAQFGFLDALHNLHRMDASLLDGFMSEGPGGLRLLAGLSTPIALDIETSDLVLLFDVLLDHYKFVIVDASGRMDKTSRTVCDLSELVLLVVQADVASLWSAGRVREFLASEPENPRVQLVLNRYRKINGFSDEDARAATNCRIFWKVPNQFNVVGPAIDRGSPVVFQANSEVARSFSELADALVRARTNQPPTPAGAGKKEKESSPKVLDRLITLTSTPGR